LLLKKLIDIPWKLSINFLASAAFILFPNFLTRTSKFLFNTSFTTLVISAGCATIFKAAPYISDFPFPARDP